MSMETRKNKDFMGWESDYRNIGTADSWANEGRERDSRRQEFRNSFQRRFLFQELSIRNDLAASRLHSARSEVREAAKIVEKYYADWRVCDEKLRSLPLSQDRLRHVFRAETGMSIQQYQRHCQLWQAAMLLTCTSLCVCEVAEAVGLPEAAYFGKIFREQYGETPNAFRENTFWGRRCSPGL